MPSSISEGVAQITKWLNDNQGLLSAAIFVATLLLGWVSGIFSALRRRPKFKLGLIDGPTLCCTFSVGKNHNSYDVHRTGIALYLVIANTGSAPSSIGNIAVGYHWHLKPFTLQWIRYRLGWFWLTNQAAALEDFQARIGGNVKVYPFLTQRNFLSPAYSDTFLNVGQSTNGVVYFEQSDSWGGCFPTVKNGRVLIRVRVLDAFGGKHTLKATIPSVSLDEARKFNPSFGKTLAELRGDPLPVDRQQ